MKILEQVEQEPRSVTIGLNKLSLKASQQDQAQVDLLQQHNSAYRPMAVSEKAKPEKIESRIQRIKATEQKDAASSHNEMLIKKLCNSLATETNPVAKKFLMAVIAEIRKR